MTIDCRAIADALENDIRSAVADATAEATERIAALEKELKAAFEATGSFWVGDYCYAHVADILSATREAAEARAEKAEAELRIARGWCHHEGGKAHPCALAQAETLAAENKRLTEALREAREELQPMGVLSTALGQAVASRIDAALAAPRPPDPAPLMWHYRFYLAGKIACGAQQPNEGATSVPEHVTCLKCLGLRPTPVDPARDEPTWHCTGCGWRMYADPAQYPKHVIHDAANPDGRVCGDVVADGAAPAPLSEAHPEGLAEGKQGTPVDGARYRTALLEILYHLTSGAHAFEDWPQSIACGKTIVRIITNAVDDPTPAQQVPRESAPAGERPPDFPSDKETK